MPRREMKIVISGLNAELAMTMLDRRVMGKEG